jgi:ABC-type nitrate/sulfonate/bicarbonate transport system permease component
MKKNLLIGLLIIVVIWFIVTEFRLIDPLFLSSPIDVLIKLFNLIISGEILRDTLGTLFRLTIGFSIGLLLGVPIGIVFGYFKRLYSFVELPIDFFRSVPVASLFPLFLVFFGIGDMAKISTAAWSTFLIILVNTTYGVKSCSENRLMVAKTMKATRLQTFAKIVFPNSLPQIIQGIRTALSIALVVVVMTEMFMGSKSGLGRRIYNSSLVYETAELYAAILVTGILGYTLNKLVIYCENEIIHWRGK